MLAASNPMAAPIAWLRKNGHLDVADIVELIVLENIVQHYAELLEEIEAEQVSA